MADIGLDRADPAGIACRSRSSKHPAQGSAFDGVANAGAGAMRLDIDDLCGVNIGIARPVVRPSEFTPEPAMMAITGFRSASASANGCNTTTAPPSDRT